MLNMFSTAKRISYFLLLLTVSHIATSSVHFSSVVAMQTGINQLSGGVNWLLIVSCPLGLHVPPWSYLLTCLLIKQVPVTSHSTSRASVVEVAQSTVGAHMQQDTSGDARSPHLRCRANAIGLAGRCISVTHVLIMLSGNLSSGDSSHSSAAAAGR